MKIVAHTGREDIAMLYIMEFEGGKFVECVEAIQPPLPRERKWVLLISTLFGCPVKCRMCDAGGGYQGKLSAEQIFAQIDFLVNNRYPQGRIPAEQFKIQLARMGEPALNNAVLKVLDELPNRYHAPGLMPSLSTIAPAGREAFFEQLLTIKSRHYRNGRFQFQFSIHTSDETLRKHLIPVPTWSFAQMSAYGQRLHQPGDRKITLNFALAQGNPVDPQVLLQYFDPDQFLIKITPLNPTHQAKEHGLSSHIDPYKTSHNDELISELTSAGYEVILSIGEVEENFIGSNCGQYVLRHLRSQNPLKDGYTYPVAPYPN
jgi:23S rRNA (adenine2503-C2)-methyltransferase